MEKPGSRDLRAYLLFIYFMKSTKSGAKELINKDDFMGRWARRIIRSFFYFQPSNASQNRVDYIGFHGSICPVFNNSSHIYFLNLFDEFL